MEGPECKNGFTMIANEFLEEICRIRIPGEARQVFDTIIRKTWGWKKKEDFISLSQISEATGLPRSNIVRAVKKLKSMNLISVIKNDNSQINIFAINKYYKTWKVLSKMITENAKTVIKNDTKSVIESDTYKRKERNIIKESVNSSPKSIKQILSFEGDTPEQVREKIKLSLGIN